MLALNRLSSTIHNTEYFKLAHIQLSRFVMNYTISLITLRQLGNTYINILINNIYKIMN